MKFRYFFLAMGMLVIMAACELTESADKDGFFPDDGTRRQMVQFKLDSLTDKSIIDSSQLEGQVLLVTFFATWCPPCIQEIPTLVELQKSFSKKNFSVVAFSVDEGDLELLFKIIDKYEINYPVLLADANVINGFGGVTGIPVTYLVNRKGELVNKYLGYIGHDTLEKAIKKLLAAG
ncbi:MAG: TlpA disulfide reductase family protein [Desulfobulbales bacterium]|nr:TlpA disulfide reductase family protein [Desulfobulbales bacterium]